MVVATELPMAETFAIDLPGRDATAARGWFIGGPENLLARGAVLSFVAEAIYRGMTGRTIRLDL